MVPPGLEIALRESIAASAGDVVAAWLFGSEARGTAGAGSDVDVAILYGQSVAPGLDGPRMRLQAHLEGVLRRPVDVLVLDDAPPDLVHRVMRDGILIVENDRSRRVAFQVRKQAEYFDLLPALREYRRPRRAS